MVAAVNVHQLAPNEPLSPELVLVLPPELRAQVLASLGPPVWPTPRARVTQDAAVLDEPIAVALDEPIAVALDEPIAVALDEPIAVALDESIMRSLGGLLAARAVQLGVIFAAVTILTLTMSLVAHAFR